MRYKIGFFKKVECLVKTVKKCFFFKTECLTSAYKSGKLPKRTKCVCVCVCVCIYIYNYFILIINDSLNKRFCKKIFGFNISLFKKCYVYNIFTIL